ncbi:efflux RND transporter periplasmic adaptor subunit [Psychromonas sp. PT13]|uniref:efflux RND transporter periplasmic adaptor subunit n=1 Tax=Psychromonas sp. PT13 TaxID=3439547 RepID=UPI003EBDAA89
MYQQLLNQAHRLLIGSLLLLCYPTMAAELFTVKSQNEPQWVNIDATIEAVDQATLSAQTSGRVVKVNFDTNDYVEKGNVLLEITSNEQGAQLAIAEAEVLKAQALYNESYLTAQRYKKLFPKGAISQGQLDQAEAAESTNKQFVRAAQASLKKAQESLDYTIIKAPYSGVVTQRLVEVGETINPGQPLFSGMSLNKLRAVAEIPQRYLQAIKDNPEVVVTLNNGKQILSKDITLFNYADLQTHAFKVRINLPQTEQVVLPGMWVKAKFVSGQREIITIPTTAVLTNNELTAVYRNVNEKPVLTQVRLGNEDDGYIEVLAGLQNNDQIYTDAYQKLQMLESK